MPINAIRNEYEVELTHECNWNCPYCAIKVHTLPEISSHEIIKKINSIPGGANVTLSGGEPGLLDKSTIEWVIKELKSKGCNLYLNTNGEFIRRYPRLIFNFAQIIYHCSQNLDISDQILKPSHPDVRYMLVVNDDNVGKLESFLDKYNDIKFDIVGATYNNKGDGVELSQSNRNLIAVKYFGNITKESFYRLFHEKEWEKMNFT